MFVDVDDPVKFSLLTLTNDGDAARTLSLFAYNDWVLGPPRDEPDRARSSTTLRRRRRGTILARNAYSDEFAQRVAFAHASETPRSATGDRLSFIGRNGSLAPAGGAAPPDARAASSAPGSIRARRCTSQVVLQPGEQRQIVFLLGQGADADARRAR